MSLRVIKVDENRDPIVKNGEYVFIEGVYAAMQLIEGVMRTQLGEHQYNKKQGIEYFNNVFNGNPNYQLFRSQARKMVSKFSFVEKVTDLTHTIENETLKYSMTVKTIYGTGTVSGAVGQ